MRCVWGYIHLRLSEPESSHRFIKVRLIIQSWRNVALQCEPRPENNKAEVSPKPWEETKHESDIEAKTAHTGSSLAAFKTHLNL